MAEPVSIGASLLAAGSSIAQGFNQRSQMKAQAKASELDAKYAQLRAVQVSFIRQEEMNDVISSVNLLRTGRGVGLDSATGRALRAEARKRGGEAKRQDYANEILGRDSLKLKAAGLRSAASVAPWIGFANAAGDLADAYGTYKGGKK